MGHTMSKPFTTLMILLLLVAAGAHVYRLVQPFEIVVNGNAIPEWGSIAAAVFAGFMALMLLRESRG
jgi:hypothetical protein